MPHRNHTANHPLTPALTANPHAQALLGKIAQLEGKLAEASKHTLVWDDTAKQLKKQKLELRDALAQFQQQAH